MRDTHFDSVHFRVSATRIRYLYSLLLIGELFLILGYLALKFGVHDRLPWFLHIIRNQLNLTAENVVAVWVSGMLLLSISFAAILCFQLDAGGRAETGAGRTLRYGWLVIALTFAVFSIDEIGSFHERLEKILPLALTTHSATMRHWVFALAPIMIFVFLFFMFFFFRRLAQCRLSQYLAVLGTAFLASVPFQEWVATSARVGGHLLSVLEEAAEMIGMTLIFIGFLEFAISLSARAAQSEKEMEVPAAVPVRLGDFEMRLFYIAMLASALGTLLLAWYFVPFLEDVGSRGDPRAWYPSAVLFTAGLGAFIVPYAVGREAVETETLPNTAAIGIGFICLILSQERVSGVIALTLARLMYLIGWTTESWLAETLASALPLGMCLGIVSWAVAQPTRNRSLIFLGLGFCVALAIGVSSAQMKEIFNVVVPSLIAVAILSLLRAGANRSNKWSTYPTKRVSSSIL